MDDCFDIPIVYKNEELSFPARLLMQGYTHTFQVMIDGIEVIFEADEEGQYRALLNPSLLEKNVRIDMLLLKSIAQVLESVVNGAN